MRCVQRECQKDGIKNDIRVNRRNLRGSGNKSFFIFTVFDILKKKKKIKKKKKKKSK